MIWLLLLLLCTSRNVATNNSSPDSVFEAPLERYKFSSANNSLTCSEGEVDSCPPALFCVDGQLQCKCGEYPYNYIRCNGTSSFVLRQYCVTFDGDSNVTSVGHCNYIENRPKLVESGSKHYELLHLLPPSVHQLDHVMCGFYNRTGTLCGRCLPDHYPLAYSFNMTCIPCPHVRWNWFRYIMAAYLPLTAFCIVMLFFKINITSSHLFAVVYYCQAVSMPILLRSLLSSIDIQTTTSYMITAKLFLSLYGVWNLDFFRPFYSDLCLGIGILPTLALDYGVAVYPLLLMALTYLLVNLYDKEYRLVACLCRPFRAIFSHCRNKWDIRTSLIDAFSTFFFLSNAKFLSVSVDLLVPNLIYQLYSNGSRATTGLMYSGDLAYFGKEHLPYALLAITVSCVFVCLPITLLALYQFKFFQDFLDLFPVRWYALRTFVDTFHASYKDGTQTGTRDFRWFVSMFFIMRVLQLITYNMSDVSIFTAVVTMSLVLFSIFIALLHPFKHFSPSHNTLHIIFLQLQVLFGLTAMANTVSTFVAPHLLTMFFIVGIILGIVPLLYFAVSACFWAYKHRRFSFGLTRRLRAWRSGYSTV